MGYEDILGAGLAIATVGLVVGVASKSIDFMTGKKDTMGFFSKGGGKL